MKFVSATEAKNRLGALLATVVDENDDVVIEKHGTPRAALISYEAYKELLKARDLRRRREAMAALWQLRAEVQAQNQDLDDETAEAIAEEISGEAISRILERTGNQRTAKLG